MGNTRDLSNRINESYSRLSKGQKLLATYITDNYDKAVFLTAARLGEVVGVSESTVVRFATHLGYKGYPEFQNALEELVRNKLNSIQRMEVTYGRISQSKILESVLHSDADKINTTLEKIDQEAFEIAVNTILNAKHIYIIGIRSCAPLASFMAFYFNLMFDNVHLLQTSSSSEIFEQMVRIGKDDVIIGISFPRYSMRTLKAMEFANNRNAKVITLTDSVHSPMNLYSSCNLIADSDMASIVDSLVAPLSVINALIVALCMKNRKKVAKTLEMLEAVGITCEEMKDKKTRKLIFVNEELKLRFFLAKGPDVPTYVEYGAADLGVVGRDTILEEGRKLYEVMDLGFGKCRMCICGPESAKELLDGNQQIRVATKYPNIAKDYFYNKKNQTVEIIKLNGSIELAPIVGLSEVICDIVETGSTLRENGLHVLEEVCPLSARVVVNQVSMKMESERISELLGKLKQVIKEADR